MAGIDENIVREYFEINGFLVRQFYKYQVQSRKKRAEEEIDLVVYNPNCADSEAGDVGFILSSEDISKIRQAVVSVKGWHTSTFSAAILNSSDEIFNFLQKTALKRVESMFSQGGRVFKILAIPSLPKSHSERQKSINLLKSRGVDGVLTYPHMLRNIADSIEVNNNYVKSGVLPPPKNKKYNRTHLAILMIVCAMKPVMEISAVSDIIKRSIAAGSIEDVLDEFARMYENELSSSIKKANIAVEASHNDEILSYIAIENTLKASAARTVAMHAYNSIQANTQMDKKKEPAPQKKAVSPAKGKKKESSEEEISESTENSDDTHEEND